MINAVATCFYSPSNKKVQIVSSTVDVVIGLALAFLALYSASIGWQITPLMQHSFVIGGSVYAGVSFLRAVAFLKHQLQCKN